MPSSLFASGTAAMSAASPPASAYWVASQSDTPSPLSTAAQKELAKAAGKKTAGIELYSGKYYGACILGGVLACVCYESKRLHTCF